MALIVALELHTKPLETHTVFDKKHTKTDAEIPACKQPRAAQSQVAESHEKRHRACRRVSEWECRMSLVSSVGSNKPVEQNSNSFQNPDLTRPWVMTKTYCVVHIERWQQTTIARLLLHSMFCQHLTNSHSVLRWLTKPLISTTLSAWRWQINSTRSVNHDFSKQWVINLIDLHQC